MEYTYAVDRHALETRKKLTKKIQWISLVVIGVLLALALPFLPGDPLIILGLYAVTIIICALVFLFIPLPDPYAITKHHRVTLNDTRLESFNGVTVEVILYSTVTKVAVLLSKASEITMVRIFSQGRKIPLTLLDLENIDDLYEVLKSHLGSSLNIVEERENSPAMFIRGIWVLVGTLAMLGIPYLMSQTSVLSFSEGMGFLGVVFGAYSTIFTPVTKSTGSGYEKGERLIALSCVINSFGLILMSRL